MTDDIVILSVTLEAIISIPNFSQTTEFFFYVLNVVSITWKNVYHCFERFVAEWKSSSQQIYFPKALKHLKDLL